MGKIIVIEGLDASGKDTQSRLLQERLNKEGYETYKLDLPYYDDPSSTLVKMYLGGELGDKPSDVNAYAASTFYAVDRYASFKKHWQKEYESDKIIVANRYTTSNASHQMTKLSEDEWDSYLQWLFEFEYKKMGIPEPDCVIFLDMPMDIAQKLMQARANKIDGSENKDIHERNRKYLEDTYNVALGLARKFGWKHVMCGAEGEPLLIETISEEVIKAAEVK